MSIPTDRMSNSNEHDHVAGIGEAALKKELAALLAYWRDKRAGAMARLPSRQHIDPLDIPGLLPFIFLVDVERRSPALRFRYRLIGTRLVDRYGFDITGRYLETLRDRLSYDEILQDYTLCVAQARPVSGEYEYTDGAGRKWHYQRLVLPLSEDGGTVTMLMGANCFAARPVALQPFTGAGI
ncbi:PAS domain-containing protein [Oceanibaculum pacificum]|uniref:PAS domain-containing protein n=1 Tax=Oceanibaculum pacificum TaxID=580166 RepID=A0A154VSI2_9PROT|nr:PAS domain-containing protein [Oceanibaculum pacificum]KZD04273.1 hypothetical protein AUP43_12275 [Oceanibaculum pacificum]